jgi:hypothetical protein
MLPAVPSPPAAIDPALPEPILVLLGRLDGEIEILADRFRLGRSEAAEVLRDVILLMVYRWERIESREVWALATMRRLCLRRARRRRAALAS